MLADDQVQDGGLADGDIPQASERAALAHAREVLVVRRTRRLVEKVV